MVLNDYLVISMFIFMGFMLDRSGIAEKMMKSMQELFGKTRGGLAVTVTLIGIILAASTGIIGASVVLLGLLSLPAMMKQGYHLPLALGTIAGAGTLGILIPPSIMLVIMADQLSLSVGDLFMGALVPGLVLGFFYILYIFVLGLVSPEKAPVARDRRPLEIRMVLSPSWMMPLAPVMGAETAEKSVLLNTPACFPLNLPGVNTSLIPGGELFAALEKGVIDATEFSMPAIDSAMGFHKIAKFNYYPGWHQQATFFELLINKETWNVMSSYQQNILEILCKAATLDTLAFTEAIQAKAMIDSREKHGVKIESLSDEILSALKTAWNEEAAELSGKSPMFKEAWEDLSGFRKTYEVWGQHGFLPRIKKE